MLKVNDKKEIYYVLSQDEYLKLKDIYLFLNRIAYMKCYKHKSISKLEIQTNIKKMGVILYD